MKFQKKIAVVTGGCGLFGKIQIKSLMDIGYKIIVLDKDIKSINKMKLKKDFKKASFFECDITNIDNILKIKNIILKKYKSIDVLVNNAANDTVPKKTNTKKDTIKLNIDQLSSDINVGLVGAINCSKIFGEEMVKKKYGIILNISSDLSIIAPDQRLYNHLGIKKPLSYSIVKHGLTGLTKYLASYWAKNNIRVNSFSPGGIFNNQDRVFVKKLEKLIPLGRMAKKTEYIKTIQFLCSDDSSYITGQNIVSDGGRSII